MLLLAAAAFLLPAASTSTPQDSPAAAIPASATGLSVIAIPIRASLRPLLRHLEERVPMVVDRSGHWTIEPRGRFSTRYRVARDPISIQMIGSGLHANGTLHYAVEACRRTSNPFTGTVVLFPCLSCGFEQAMPRAGFSLQSTLTWDPEWKLRSKTYAAPIEFPDRCRVTFAQVDVTDWAIAPELHRQLQEAVRTIDANTPALTRLRPYAAAAWSSLQEPVAAGPRSWLVIEPVDVSFTPIQGSGLEVTSTLLLRARIRVMVAETAPTVVKRPLPPLVTGLKGPKASVSRRTSSSLTMKRAGS